MSWEEQIKKAPYSNWSISDFKKIKNNVEMVLEHLSDDIWEKELPDILKLQYRRVLEYINDAKLVLDGMKE